MLIGRTGGTVGKSYLVQDISGNAVFASYLIRVKVIASIPNSFIKVTLESANHWLQLYERTSGTGQPNVNATSLSTILVPLPPLAEQQRIVAKVDELMSLCDDLEARLQRQETTATNLATAAVHG